MHALLLGGPPLSGERHVIRKVSAVGVMSGFRRCGEPVVNGRGSRDEQRDANTMHMAGRARLAPTRRPMFRRCCEPVVNGRGVR